MKLTDITSITSITQRGAEFFINLENPNPDKLQQDLYYLDSYGFLSSMDYSWNSEIKSSIPESYREGIDTSIIVKTSLYRLQKAAKATAEASYEARKRKDAIRTKAKEISVLAYLREFFAPKERERDNVSIGLLATWFASTNAMTSNYHAEFLTDVGGRS